MDTIVSGGSRIFGGDTILLSFPKNCMKIEKKNWSLGGCVLGAPPLDPPLIVFNVFIQEVTRVDGSASGSGQRGSCPPLSTS